MRRRPREPRTRVNERIRAPEIRVIYGEHNIVLQTHKALKKAKELGLDLVEIAPHAKPPVCRIVDYGKYKYELSKQKKTEKPKKREKEVKFRVGIEQHDYVNKLIHAEDFLAAGYKVRIQLQFRGRQMAHKELGFVVLDRVKEDLAGVANVDLEPKLNNRNILMMLSPLPKEKQKRKFRLDDEEIDLDEAEAEMSASDEADGYDSHDDDSHDDESHDDEAAAENSADDDSTEEK
ncbi:translation initiation factor IF-3 [Verrucomicrobiales bacterium BCK34]|nr:translation initiation factor IF-3 [Verrucomicrobiales bacterium BCK34]